MSGRSSEAEQALAQKYKLLQAKKAKEAQAKAKTTQAKQQPQVALPKSDAVRQAAVAALKAKRAAAAGGSAPPPQQNASTSAKKDDKPATKIKLSFVIPKREVPAPAPAAAAANKPLEGAPAQGTVEGDAQKKRPVLKRPPMRRPASQTQGGDEPDAKRAAHGEGEEEELELPPTPQLFIGDLPGHFTTDDLWEFFSSFGEVIEARVVDGYCYGFVTFGTYEEAQSVLDFHYQQPVALEDRELRVLWARARVPGWQRQGGAVPAAAALDPHLEHPRIRDARAAAAEVASQIEDHHQLGAVNLGAPPPTREMVSYEDL